MSEPADATTTSAPATIAPARSTAWPRRLALTGRVLVTLGTVGLALSFWTWWWQVSGFDPSVDPRGSSRYALLLTPGDIVPTFGNEFYIHVLTVAGLLLLPFLWLLRSTRLQGAAASGVVTFAFLASGQTVHQYWDYQGGTVHLVDSLAPRQLTVDGSIQSQLGWILNLAFFAVIVLGVVALISGSAKTPTDQRQATAQRPARPRLVRLPAAGGLTLGLILFLIGILGMGWTAVNCTEHPLFLGQCTGLTFPGVVHYGIAIQTEAFDPVASLFAIPALLVGGAVLVLIGLWWWRRLTLGLSLWLTLYLAIATFFFVVAYAGTGAIALHSADLGLQTGTWSAQSGLWVTALGLLISWLALIPLWFRAIRPAPTASESPAA